MKNWLNLKKNLTDFYNNILIYIFIEFFTGNVLLTEIIVNLKTNQTLLIILDPIRLQNGPRLIADLSFYATVPFFDSSRRWQFHEKKNIPKFHENHEIFQIYLNLWPTISAQTVHEGLTATSRIILI